MPSGVDSYYNDVQDPYAYQGAMIGSQVVGETGSGYPMPGGQSFGSMPSGNYPGSTMSDNFNERGERIIRVDPIPGMVSQPR